MKLNPALNWRELCTKYKGERNGTDLLIEYFSCARHPILDALCIPESYHAVRVVPGMWWGFSKYYSIKECIFTFSPPSNRHSCQSLADGIRQSELGMKFCFT